MEARATSRFTRITAQKARLVVNLIRGKSVESALGILEYTPKRAARTVAKTLRSAVANAEHAAREGNSSLDVDALVITRAVVNEGPKLKRFTPAAMGRATPIQKRTSHVEIIVTEKKIQPKPKPVQAAPKAAAKTAAKKTAAAKPKTGRKR